MMDPYAVLGLAPDSDDEAIRRKYLELVKQYPPSQHPEKFSAIREAYDRLRDLETRVRYRLFEAGEKDSVEKIIEDLKCQSPRHRVALKTLLSLLAKR